MNNDEYIRVLQNNLLPFLEDNEKAHFLYEQDNGVVHKSKATRLNQQNISVVEWPACFPDMNPTENLWGNLVRCVNAGNRR